MVAREHADGCGAFHASPWAPRFRFAVAEETHWVPGRQYDCPLGSHWATTAEGFAAFTGTHADGWSGGGDEPAFHSPGDAAAGERKAEPELHATDHRGRHSVVDHDHAAREAEHKDDR